ncbi:hypothetical protein ND856_18775 [Leptospira bandrabouensis]|uniref:hypothetical protein n=1 Tax=Leptospira bandrabouensis TaxID=2484903 RepID=UPI00223D9306|nr:hypothetical protein [Leptospira bandrabouensis]MCW7479351.1 hypothetical protein [Leptospira bandrabouensis]MCW7487033.1 hypothetical protein [Leptospira bandrabouensis]
MHKDTKEWHLFKTKIETRGSTGGIICKVEMDESVCSLMNYKKAIRVLKRKCVNEENARLQAANILKRDACGTCVSTLYGSI